MNHCTSMVPICREDHNLVKQPLNGEGHDPELSIDTRNLGFHRQSYHYKLFNFPTYIEDIIEPQTFYNNCYCNEYNAMVGRHFIPDLPENNTNPALTNLFVNENLKYCDVMKELLLERGGYRLPSYQQVIKDTKGSKKKRYQRAYENILNKRIYFSEPHARVNFFVKLEKWPISKIDKEKPPRGIQFRSYEYLLALKRTITPLVELTKIDRMVGEGPSFNPHHVFTKNNTPSVIASNFKEAWDSFKTPVAVCLDHSCFDGHYSSNLLEQEMRRYQRITGVKNNSLLIRLLKRQHKNKGFSAGGIRFKVKGKRCSGEFTTSHGNGETNYLMIRTILLFLGIHNFKIFVNGDDSVIICERDDMEKIVNNLALFKNFNMDTEVEHVADIFEEITFCQTSPVCVNGVYTMIRKPMRVLSRLPYSQTNWAAVLDRFLVSVGLCELSINMGVPILQELAVWLIRKGGSDRPLTTHKTDHYDASVILGLQPIQQSTRESFNLAFGIDSYDQLRIEKILRDDSNNRPDYTNRIFEKLNYKLY